MPFLAPSFARLPPLSFLLADQTEPRKKNARHLGISLRTLQRYQASGNAPSAVYLALCFEFERLRGVIRALERPKDNQRPTRPCSTRSRLQRKSECTGAIEPSSHQQ